MQCCFATPVPISYPCRTPAENSQIKRDRHTKKEGGQYSCTSASFLGTMEAFTQSSVTFIAVLMAAAFDSGDSLILPLLPVSDRWTHDGCSMNWVKHISDSSRCQEFPLRDLGNIITLPHIYLAYLWSVSG